MASEYSEFSGSIISTEGRQLQGQHPIYISHSWQEKAFVVKLAHALRIAGHDPFFDTISVPVGGEWFSTAILKLVGTCKLGVVVLSPGFLTSYWPMTELHILSTSSSSLRILPLYYKIQPSDLKRSSPHFSEWQEAWRSMSKEHRWPAHFIEWEYATDQLSNVNGVVFDPHLGEDFFIQQVVRHVCSYLSPVLGMSTIPHLTGHKRLTQVVASLFEEVPIRTHVKACAIGFHAIAGQGKTTICKLMVNHYTYDCSRRCTLIEFPSNDCSDKQMLELCKRILRQLTSLAEDRIDALHSCDECMQQMKIRLANHNVFIALDNVGEKSLDYAQRILDIEFDIDSKILVTSRSTQVLSTLLKNRELVMPLPSLNEEEARQLFIESFNRNQSYQPTQIELEDSEVDNLTKKYQFNSRYHPAAIIALAASSGRRGLKSWSLFQGSKSPSLEDIDEQVNEIIRRNFESLPNIRRDLLLDVTMIYIPYVKDSIPSSCAFVDAIGERQVCFEELWLISWLSSLYGDKMDSGKIKWNLIELACDGLLAFDDGFANVSVHDMYKGLVTREAFVSGRFVLPMKDSLMLVRDIKWADVGRVVWCKDESLHNWSSEPVPQGMCLPNLQLLMILHQEGNFLEGNCRLQDYMPHLRVLDVRYGGTNRSSSRSELIYLPFSLSWLSLHSPSTSDWALSMRNELRVLDLRNMTIQEPLFLGANLELFSVSFCISQKFLDLKSLTKLKHMSLSDVKALYLVSGLSGRFSELQVLEIKGCLELRRIEGLGEVPNLRRLEVIECPYLMMPADERLPESLRALALDCWMPKQPNLSGMKVLEHILLRFEEEPVAFVEIRNLPCLLTLELQGQVAEISSISELPRLKRLELADCSVLRELKWSSLIDLPSLEALEINECHDLQEVVGEPHLTIRGLQYLGIYRCNKLRVVDGSDYFFEGDHFQDMERF